MTTEPPAMPPMVSPHIEVQLNRGQDFFMPVVMTAILLFGYAGYYMKTHNPPVLSVLEKATMAHTTHFIMEEQKKVPEPVKPKKKEDAPVKEPIDLAEKPLPAQEKNETVETPPEQPPEKPVRRVYGLKKVYSTGIGASGNLSDAIIGKHGNTLDTDIDTIKATEGDLLGTPVSVTTVTTFPRLKSNVKPEYTKEMLKNRIEGTVRVKIIVDIDGKVKRVIVLDDLGYGSKEMVAKACFKMVFEPAMIDNTPVSTAIIIRITFKMLDG